MVLIGIDPHKSSHTAVAVDEKEVSLAELTGRADRHQLERLLKWSIEFPDRIWAIESANGLGQSARATVHKRRRTGSRRPADSVGSGACARIFAVTQERSQRRTIDGDRSTSGPEAQVCGERRSCGGSQDVRGSSPGPRVSSHTGDMSAPCTHSQLGTWGNGPAPFCRPGGCCA
jgi:hypothetical protein